MAYCDHIFLQIIKLPMGTWHKVSSAPTVLRRLFLAELFGWMGFMCHNMFFTDFVGQYMYGGLPDAQEHTELAVLYDEGVRMGSWGLFLHSLTGGCQTFVVQSRFYCSYLMRSNETCHTVMHLHAKEIFSHIAIFPLKCMCIFTLGLRLESQ